MPDSVAMPSAVASMSVFTPVVLLWLQFVAACLQVFVECTAGMLPHRLPLATLKRVVAEVAAHVNRTRVLQDKRHMDGRGGG
mgnify:CR=1 FL=1